MAKNGHSLRRIVLRRARRLAAAVNQGSALAESYFAHRIVLDYLFHLRPDDLFIVCYPKSGTTLMQMMLYQMVTDGDMGFPHIESVSPWFEHMRWGLHDIVEEAPSPRIFKSHLRYPYMPRGARSIYLVRNLYDVTVSAYHHECLVTGVDIGLDLFAEQFLLGHSLFGCWFKHLESWWPHRHDPDVLFLRYEEVVADLPATARRVADFYGLPLDAATLDRVVERCKFSFMKEHEAKFDPRRHQIDRGQRQFIRKGESGEGQVLLTPAQVGQMGERIEALAKKLGCSPDEL